MLARLKAYIPEQTKIKAKLLLTSSNDSRWTKYADCPQKVIYLFLAGYYQNLGDMALTYSQKKFLETAYPDAVVVPIPSGLTYSAVKTIKRIIRKDDLITIIGGGNMDDMYVSLENARLHVVRSFPNHKIISFPQTFAFSDTEYGRKRLAISRKVYNSHHNLTIFVREPNSLSRIQKMLPDVSIGFCPDIVLSLDKLSPVYERTEIMCCLRNDKELNLASEFRSDLIQAIQSKFHEVLFKDTVDVSLEQCSPEKYEDTLEEFWDMLRHCKVVVTDRLHCMIFCVITGTPCVVMDNSNHKISGVYNAWLKDIPYITMLSEQDTNSVLEAMSAMEHKQIETINLSKTHSQFDSLKEACLK